MFTFIGGVKMTNLDNGKANEDSRKLSQELKKAIVNVAQKPNPLSVVVFNPQGVVGEHSIKYMNAPGTTTMGGQITYELGWDKGVENQLPIMQHTLVTQQVYKPNGKDFNGNFAAETEGKSIIRQAIGEEGRFVDKEDINPITHKNEYYTKMEKFGRDFAKNNRVPGVLKCEYFDAVIAATAAIDEWKNMGVKELPKLEFTPHSLGYRKIVSMLSERVEQSINEKIKDLPTEKKVDSNELIKSTMTQELNKLLNDGHYDFPIRIYAERVGSSFMNVKINSEKEKNDQLLNASPYYLDCPGLPSVRSNSENMKPITPGVDTERFGINDNPIMKKHEDTAKRLYNERLQLDIAPSRRDYTAILGLGRLNKDKNFHGLSSDFISNLQLNDRANLVLVVNGPIKDLNVNYIKEMQEILKNNSKKSVLKGEIELNDHQKEIKIDTFKGSSLEQLINLAEILNHPDAAGKWTSISLPDGNDYAGLQRSLGRDKKAIGGLFSFKEPYGLAPFETAACGIPVVVSTGSGAAREIIDAGGKGLDPNKPGDIAKALNQTLDDLKGDCSIRKSQADYAETKSWGSVASKELEWLLPNTGDTLKDMSKLKLEMNQLSNKKDFTEQDRSRIKEIRTELKDKKEQLVKDVKFEEIESVKIPLIQSENPEIIQVGKNLITSSIEKDFKEGKFDDLCKKVEEKLKQRK